MPHCTDGLLRRPLIFCVAGLFVLSALLLARGSLAGKEHAEMSKANFGLSSVCLTAVDCHGKPAVDGL